MIRRRDLRFQRGQPFKVVQLTDLHLDQPADDALTQQVIAGVLAAEADADLIVITGDIVSGWLSDGAKDWVQQRWQRLVEPLVAAGIPYAICLGNHDLEANLGARDLVTLDQGCSELSLTQHGRAELPGSGNYWLSILPSDGGAEEAMRMWFLDSIRTPPWWWSLITGTEPNITQRMWLMREGQYARGRGIGQLAFTHVPLAEHMTLWNQGHTRGSKGEAVCCAGYHAGMFHALREAGVSAVYCGHDHANDYCGSLHGMRLAYGRVTGAAGYGDLPKGARVILLREGEDPAVSETYFRLPDGSKHLQQPSQKTWYSRLQWIGR